ncbi:DEAD/DEAH box helicase [Actinocatenispora rupis]|uniref:DEAD/DEAH box helicase n=1 Tax=Actinocatenispora rupis TaxID=519421 RepID=UPI001EF3140B|nr:DEAD/DEAH box helicase [Actinocatenispora rupis]
MHELSARAPVRADSPTFRALGVRDETVEALAAVGIEHAFAIQQDAIPIALRGSDVIGQAPTGTGKTLGFGVPILERVLGPAEGADGRPQALVVLPTRELGLQVARDIETAGKLRGIRVLPVYGGRAYEPQIDALKSGVDVVVGTPGRLLDLAKSKHLVFTGVRILVLDEADRMLDLGFQEDIEKIVGMLPADRQTMLFSATMPDPIVALARKYLRRPMTIHATHTAETGPNPLTEQFVYRTHSLNKAEVVARILQAEGRGLTMVFCRTKRAAQKLSDDLDFRGFAAAAVHGDLGQGAREQALRAFRTGKIDVLVATDVAARGLDVSGVTHVINYDCPEDPDTYTHRIGRTGRAGASGVAVTFVDWEDLPRWKLIHKALGSGVADPPETYHTSDHLYADLNIPAGAPATLAPERRTRAGLAAEEQEDIEPHHKPAARRGRPRRRAGRSERPDQPRTDGHRGETPAGEPTGTRRRRRRRLDGDAVEERATESAPAASEQAPAAESGDAPAKRRNRRRRRKPSVGARGANADPSTEAGEG